MAALHFLSEDGAAFSMFRSLPSRRALPVRLNDESFVAGTMA